jgi:hypothetical protein
MDIQQHKQLPFINSFKYSYNMTVYYSYFKRFSKFSIGGTITGVNKKTAKTLITRFKGVVEQDKYPERGQRRIILNNRNSILIYLGE